MIRKIIICLTDDVIDVRLLAESNIHKLSLNEVFVSLVDSLDLSGIVNLRCVAKEVFVKIEIGVEGSTAALMPFLVDLVEMLGNHVADALVIFVAFFG